MNSDDLTEIVQQNSSLNQEESRRVVRSILKSVHNALIDGRTVKLRHVGTLHRRRKAQRNLVGLRGRATPETGHETIGFRPSEQLLGRLKPSQGEGRDP